MRLYAGFGLLRDPGFDSTKAGVVGWDLFATRHGNGMGAGTATGLGKRRLGQAGGASDGNGGRGDGGQGSESAGVRARREARARLLHGVLPAAVVLETSTSVLCVAAHPMLPAVVAAGGRSGEVFVWDTSRAGDPLVGSSRLDDYNHRDGVVSVRWFQEASTREYLLLSASADGRVNLWRPLDPSGPGMRVPVMGLRAAASGMVARKERRRRQGLLDPSKDVGTSGAGIGNGDGDGGLGMDGAGPGSSAGGGGDDDGGFDFGDDGADDLDAGGRGGASHGGAAARNMVAARAATGDTSADLELRLSHALLPCEGAPLPAAPAGLGPSGSIVLGCEGGAVVYGYMSGIGSRVRASRSLQSSGDAYRVLQSRGGARMRWDADAAWVATNPGNNDATMSAIVKAAERLATAERADGVSLALFFASRPPQPSLFPSPVRAAMVPHGAAVSTSDASPFDRRLVLTGCADGTLRLSSVLGGSALVELEPEGAGRMEPVGAAAFSRVRPLVIACGTATGTVHVFDLYGLGTSAAACRLMSDGQTVTRSALDAEPVVGGELK